MLFALSRINYSALLHLSRINYSALLQFVIYFPTLFIAACAAANLAIGTLNGEQDT